MKIPNFSSEPRYVLFYSSSPRTARKKFFNGKDIFGISRENPLETLAERYSAIKQELISQNNKKPFHNNLEDGLKILYYPKVTKKTVRLMQLFYFAAFVAFVSQIIAYGGISFSALYVSSVFAFGIAKLFNLRLCVHLYKINKKFNDISFSQEEMLNWPDGQIIFFFDYDSNEIESAMIISRKPFKNYICISPLSDMEQRAYINLNSSKDALSLR